MKSFKQPVNHAFTEVPELFPWDILKALQKDEPLMILDIRERDEFDLAHIKGSLWMPRGLLEPRLRN